MKDKKIIVFLVSIFISLLWFGILTHITNKVAEPIEESTILETAVGSGTCAFLDNEARKCIASYTWFLDYPSEDFDRVSINLVVKHTIRSYFIRYSYTEFYNSVEENTKELMAIIEDSVFAIQPIGFKLTNLTVVESEHFKTK